VKSEVATFLEVFPEGMIFANLANGQGYDVVLVGQTEPTVIDLDAIDAKLSLPEYAPVVRSLAEVGFRSVPELMATFAAKKPEIDPWLDDAEVTRDRNLRLQYLAGMGVNLYEADARKGCSLARPTVCRCCKLPGAACSSSPFLDPCLGRGLGARPEQILHEALGLGQGESERPSCEPHRRQLLATAGCGSGSRALESDRNFRISAPWRTRSSQLLLRSDALRRLDVISPMTSAEGVAR